MATPAKDRNIPPPAISPENEPFFASCKKGVLLVKECRACAKLHYYPRAFCPSCFSDDVEWRAASGRGTIYSYSVTRLGVPEPFAIAYVTLEEGVRMMTNIVDCDLDGLKIGMDVRLTFKAASDGTPLPMFTPAVP